MLCGYTIKKRDKEYVQKGLIDKIKGEKISPNTLIIRVNDLLSIKQALKDYKVKYWLKDIWSK